MGKQKHFFEIFRKFGHVPSKRFASPQDGKNMERRPILLTALHCCHREQATKREGSRRFLVPFRKIRALSISVPSEQTNRQR
jgi:hypothetical protein